MQARASHVHLTQGSFTGRFYLMLDENIQRNYSEYKEDFWKRSTVLDVGSGFGAGLLGFNMVLGVKKLIGIEIQSKLVHWQKQILECLTNHNGRTNWESFTSHCCDLQDSATNACISAADVVFCLNLKFESQDNETLRSKIIDYARLGTIVITIFPFGRHRLNKRYKIGAASNDQTPIILNLLGGFEIPDELCSWHSLAKDYRCLTKKQYNNRTQKIQCYIYKVDCPAILIN